jgi:hypothetical protein
MVATQIDDQEPMVLATDVAKQDDSRGWCRALDEHVRSPELPKYFVVTPQMKQVAMQDRQRTVCGPLGVP